MITCQINRIISENLESGFSICQATVLEGKQSISYNIGNRIVIKGYFPKNTSLELMVDGEWKLSKYGYELTVKEFKEKLPSSPRKIHNYLLSIVGNSQENTIDKIINHFGKRTLEVLQASPEMLLNVRGVGRKKITAVLDSYKNNRSLQEVVNFLRQFGISLNKCAKIANTFGSEAMHVILNAPYRLCEIDGIGFLLVERIAKQTAFNLQDSLRIRGAIKYILQQASSQGHLCLPQKEMLAQAYMLLNGNEDFEKSRPSRAIADYLHSNNVSALMHCVENEVVSLQLISSEIKAMAMDNSLKGDNHFAYLPENYDQEVECANIISKRLSVRNKTISEEQIRKEIVKQQEVIGIRLANKQVEAVIAGVNNNTCIITGGPGTGKTTVLKMVLTVCQKFYNLTADDVTLLAPTGKASQRMRESVGEDYAASTIHSCLSIGENGQRSFKNIDSKIVVVDESSMVDNYICWCLLNAVSSNTKLIIIGDAEQLPSVGAGNVLYELLKCQQIPTVRLDVIYRQSGTSSIVTNSDLIRRGITNLKWENDFKFFAVHETYDFPDSDKSRGEKIQQEAANIVVEQFIKAVSKSSVDDVQVLCPMRKEGVIAGTTELNRAIQDKINPHAPHKAEVRKGKTVFRVGDKVILTKNNYELEWEDKDGCAGCGLFNGDVGYIQSIKTNDSKVYIDFSGKLACLDYTQMNEVDLAYAITIHKSQGSEYKTCIIPLLTQFSVMLKRNLLYTGITRAKKDIIIVGHKRAIYKAITTNVIANRYTQLGDRIIKNKEKRK